MSIQTTSASGIPDAPYYVCATDAFMSGWGEAVNMTNRVVCPCDTWDEARYVEDRLSLRHEMKRVTICGAKPKTRAGVLYSVFDRESATAWYPRNDSEVAR